MCVVIDFYSKAALEFRRPPVAEEADGVNLLSDQLTAMASVNLTLEF